MKKILFFLVLIFLFSPSTFIVFGENNQNYYRVINENAPLYEDEHLSKILFYLPYSYYVKVINERQDTFEIEIYGENNTPAFIGYALKEHLFKDDLDIKSPYPNVKITTCTSTVLYQDANCTENQIYLFPNRTFTYYGYNYNAINEKVYLIGTGEKIGFIKESTIFPFSISNHPNPLTFIVETDNQKEEIQEQESVSDNKDSENTLLKVGIICSLLVAGALGLYVVLRKKEKPKKNSGYYDENEYE